MPPRKTKAAAKRGSKKEEEKVEAKEEDVLEASDVQQPVERSSEASGDEKDVIPANVDEASGDQTSSAGNSKGKAKEVVAEENGGDQSPAVKMTMDERAERLRQLRLRMNQSSIANRKDLVEEHNRNKTSARENARLERKLRQAEELLEERDAREAGEDWERKKNWEYSIEDNERWEKKLEEKEARKDKGLGDFSEAAERKYQRLVSDMKPDIVAYKMQRSAIAGLSSSSAESAGSSGALIASGSARGDAAVVRREDLYRDANTLVYGDHKPSEEGIDRVIKHLNLDAHRRAKRSRKRDDEDGDVTYINDRNKHFNKKIARFYDKYTAEIRENFERGTAL